MQLGSVIGKESVCDLLVSFSITRILTRGQLVWPIKIPVELGYTICETITSWINPTYFLLYGSFGGGRLGAEQGSGNTLSSGAKPLNLLHNIAQAT